MRPLLLIVVLLAATHAFGRPLLPPQEFTFMALDTNRDYAISEDEAARSVSVARNFQNMDLDQDGGLSPLEFGNLVLALSVPPNPFPVPGAGEGRRSAQGER